MVLLLGTLQACTAAPTPAPTATPTAIPPSDTPQPSATAQPSDTPTLPATATSTQTPTATQTVTPSETPRPSFAGFKVDSAEIIGYGMTLRFTVPGISQNFVLKVNNTYEYKCTFDTKTPDKLYCSGNQFYQGQNVKLSFYSSSGDKTPVFETTWKVALVKTQTPDPRTLAAAAPSCPNRGKNVTGEVEYRKLNGGYCIVATCNDACGYYYSVNTCPSGTEHNGIYQFSGPPPVVCK